MAADDDDGFFARHRAKFIFAIIALLGGGALYVVKTSKPAETKAAAPVISVKPLPPMPKPIVPPPPPPKPPPPQQKQEKMEAEAKPEDKPPDAPKPAEKPAETLGTNLKGEGEGLAGLGGTGNGGGLFGGAGGGGGSRFGWYAGQVQGTVANALRKNSATKKAKMTIQVRIWPDTTTGRITRVNLDGTTGDPSLDKAIQEALNGLQLQQPPPQGMHLPIVMRLTAKRP